MKLSIGEKEITPAKSLEFETVNCIDAKVIDSIEKITLNKDDVLVLKINPKASTMQIERLAEQMKYYFPENKLIILTHDADLEVYVPKNGSK